MATQVLALVASFVVGVGLGLLGRALLRSRVRLSWSEAVFAGIVGAVGGATVAALAVDLLHDNLPLVAVATALALTLAVLLVMERVRDARRLPRGSAADFVRAGESAGVEFKSSARYNRRTGLRDEKLERVVAKTVAAFLNAEGGVLLIGVADDGSVPGLADDYALMKVPDRDRFELWLRDLLGTTLGTSSTAGVRVEFEHLDDQDVCLVRVPPSRRPVFLRVAKGEAVFVVRVGNSSRDLPVDEALVYCSDRWGRGALRGATSR